MDELIRIGPFLVGVIVLVVTRSRWGNDLMIPMNLGRWFIASFWLVYPIAFFFWGSLWKKARCIHEKGF